MNHLLLIMQQKKNLREAYAVLDMNTDTLCFKRYVDLDTSGFEWPFDTTDDTNRVVDAVNKKMYLRNVETDKDRFESSLTSCEYIGGDKHCPKKIVFEDAIKPTFTNGSGLFHDTPSLELLDLSWLVINNKVDATSTFNRSGLKYLDLSHWKFKNKENRRSVFATSFMDMPNLVYLDLSNMTSPECGSYGSADFDFGSSVKVLKMNSNYNPVYKMMGYGNDNNFYNTNIGDFTDEIYYRDGSCKYLSGGSYIYIAENSAIFNNRYKEVPIINPNTNNVLLIVIILLVLFIGYSNIIVKIYNNSN